MKRSHQLWKFWVTLLATMIGAAAMVFGIMHATDPAYRESWAQFVMGGVLITALGFAGACLAIGCPACEARWFWIAIRTQKFSGWGIWLSSLAACPKCGADFTHRG